MEIFRRNVDLAQPVTPSVSGDQASPRRQRRGRRAALL